jgi:rod shape-determining protein MreD
LLELGATILIYPLVVLVTRTFMGVRRAAPGELDALGGRA